MHPFIPSTCPDGSVIRKSPDSVGRGLPRTHNSLTRIISGTRVSFLGCVSATFQVNDLSSHLFEARLRIVRLRLFCLSWRPVCLGCVPEHRQSQTTVIGQATPPFPTGKNRCENLQRHLCRICLSYRPPVGLNYPCAPRVT